MAGWAGWTPSKWWARSLPFQVVVITLAAAVLILVATGWFLMDQSSRGIIAGKTQASVAEAAAVVANIQRDLRSTDLRTTSANERVMRLAREAANRGQAGNQYFVVVETPISQIGSATLSQASIPAALRQKITGSSGLWSTPTLLRFTDGRPDEPGLVIGGNLEAPGQTPYPIFFLFPTTQEKATLEVVQQATLATGLFLLVGLTLTVYLVSTQVLRPIRAARLAAEKLASGRLDDRMAAVGTEDLASLAHSMNHMADELAKKISQLQNLSLVQQRFVSDVSHELRTPLTTIRMAADVLYSHRLEFDPLTRRSTELLATELDRFELLLTDLLEISRFDAGVAHLTLDEVDLTVLAREEIDALRALAATSRTELVLNAERSCPAQIDKRRIQRILRNLITNAIEHGEGKPITVFVRGDRESVAIAVRDRGVGLSAAESLQVFNRFWRADPSRGRQIGGTGLGLSIAAEDARLHGGWLDVWGQPGAGAQFRLTLPRDPAVHLKRSPWPKIPPDVKEVADVELA